MSNTLDFGSQDKHEQKEQQFFLPSKTLLNNDSIEIDLSISKPEEEIVVGRNSRCVSVDTILSAPLGRRKKKSFKGKSELVKFRCSIYEKKLLIIKAKRSGLTLSEYVRRVAFEQHITERFTDEHIDIYKMLIKYHNNFKSIGNMFKKRNPKLTQTVHELADEIKAHLKKFQE